MVKSPQEKILRQKVPLSSIGYWKKAILFFMPNKLMQCTKPNSVGNPTKSIEIDELIKRVKKLEVQKLNVASKA